jgi:hypothetical protein
MGSADGVTRKPCGRYSRSDIASPARLPRAVIQWPDDSLAGLPRPRATLAGMRTLAHIQRLSDEGGRGWLVDVRCVCGRTGWLEPAILAQQVGWDATLESLTQRLRCTQCGQKELTLTAIPAPRPRGIPKNPH